MFSKKENILRGLDTKMVSSYERLKGKKKVIHRLFRYSLSALFLKREGLCIVLFDVGKSLNFMTCHISDA